MCSLICNIIIIFFFNDTATTEIYTLSLHDALPISRDLKIVLVGKEVRTEDEAKAVLGRLKKSDIQGILSPRPMTSNIDRKSTRLNSSHLVISYAVFCLKKKK